MFGIPILLHPTWFVVFALVAYVVWTLLARGQDPMSGGLRLAICLVTSGLFFASILLHELGHSLLAMRHSVSVRQITLFFLGGVAVMEKEPESPRAELEIAIAGPVVSVLLGLGFIALGATFDAGSPGARLFGWLGLVNLAVALFNLLPGFPMDGGRVLRAAVWAATGDATRATRVAAGLGQLMAYAMIAVGAVIALSGALDGLWLALVGWLVLQASGATQRQLAMDVSLRGLAASDVMSRDVERVEAATSVAIFAREFLMRGERWALVEDDGQAIGLVTLTDVKRIPQERWEGVPVREIGTPMTDVVTAAPETPVSEILRVLIERGMNQIPIVDDGNVLGAVTRQHLVQAMEIRGAHA